MKRKKPKSDKVNQSVFLGGKKSIESAEEPEKTLKSETSTE